MLLSRGGALVRIGHFDRALRGSFLISTSFFALYFERCKLHLENALTDTQSKF
jgi:hypothetical protein